MRSGPQVVTMADPVLVRKIKAEGLAHLSYLVGSGDGAAVVDPRRDCQIYVDLADEAGMDIVLILETHRNEDYVTGSRELAAVTGAPIFHGDLGFGYGAVVREGQEFDVGQVRLRALSTPGHTPESMSFVLFDLSSGPEPVAAFTGDALFVGEVGRTDLMGPERAARMASQLFDSLHCKILPLGPGTIIYPAHGAGSACGGSISSREESTIGLEMCQNPALQFSTREGFVDMKLREKLELPPYFKRMEELNLEGQPVLGGTPRLPLISPEGLTSRMSGGVVVDVRSPPAFAGVHIPGSVSIPLQVLPHYAGWVLPYDRPLYLVLGREDPAQAVRDLIRVGYDRLGGRLNGGMEGWAKAGLPAEGFAAMIPMELEERRRSGEDIFILDMRNEREWESGHVEGAHHIPLQDLVRGQAPVPRDRKVAVMCASGLRGSIGASILAASGHRMIANVIGGTTGWSAAGLPMVRPPPAAEVTPVRATASR